MLQRGCEGVNGEFSTFYFLQILGQFLCHWCCFSVFPTLCVGFGCFWRTLAMLRTAYDYHLPHRVTKSLSFDEFTRCWDAIRYDR